MNTITYADDIARIWSSLQFELLRSGITHQKSSGGCPKNTYDDTWKPFNMFGVTHKKNSFLQTNQNQRLFSTIFFIIFFFRFEHIKLCPYHSSPNDKEVCYEMSSIAVNL